MKPTGNRSWIGLLVLGLVGSIVLASAAQAQRPTQLGPLNSSNVRKTTVSASGALQGGIDPAFRGNYRLGGATGLQNDSRGQAINRTANYFNSGTRQFYAGERFYGLGGPIAPRVEINIYAPRVNERLESGFRNDIGNLPQTDASLAPRNWELPARMPRDNDRIAREPARTAATRDIPERRGSNYVDYRSAFRRRTHAARAPAPSSASFSQPFELTIPHPLGGQ
jgi:hypothetical protein